MANLSNINNILRTGSLGVGINRDPLGAFEISSATKPGVKMFNTSASGKTYEAYSDANGNYIIYDQDADNNRFVINTSGNATFSGNVDINGGEVKISGNYAKLFFEDTGGTIDAYIVNNADGLFFGKTNSPAPANDILSLDLSTQNVGIRTTDPLDQLHINNDTSNSYATLRLEGSNRGGIINFYNAGYPVFQMLGEQSGNMYFATSGAFASTTMTTRFTFKTTGAFGVGTTSFAPTVLKQLKIGDMGSGIVGEIHDAGLAAGASRLLLCATGTGGTPAISGRHYSAAYGYDIWMSDTTPWNTYIDNRHPSSGFQFRNNTNNDGSEVPLMIIKGDGNVGIGTAIPTRQLHLKRTSGDVRGIMVETTVAASYAEVQVKAASEFRIGTGGSSTVPNGQFYIYDATAGAHRFDIDANGNVGIGTTSPDFALDISAIDSGVQLQIGRTNTNVGSAWMGASSGGFSLGIGAYGVGNSVTDPKGFLIDASGNLSTRRRIQAKTDSGVSVAVTRNLFVAHGGSGFDYTFDPVALFGAALGGGKLLLEVTGWPGRLNCGYIVWRNDGGGSSKIGTGVVSYVQTAVQSAGNVAVSLPSSNTNEIKITFTGWHTNDHGWSCYIKNDF